MLKLVTGICVENAGAFNDKAFRKGHATEMASHGAPLQLILQAGEWSSAAFLAYANAEIAELRALAQHVLDESDNEA